jgi:hypothetical protein
MNKNDYTNKAMQQLSDTEHYELINNKTQEEITAHVINEYEKIKTRITTSKLNKDDKQQLIKYTRPYASSTHFPKIYFNPKTHKPNIPLRPITSGISWATEKIAILIDEYLKPIIYANDHIPKDTFDFLKIIEKNQYSLITEDYNNLYFLTFDVVALYTNIPNYEAAFRVTELLTKNNTSNPTLQKIPPHLFTEAVLFLLNNNYFTFQDKIYRQKHGIAMGTPAGGAIANTYMLKWDEKIKTSTYSQYIHTYTRYFDDGFIIWNGPHLELLKFQQHMNTIDKHIQTTSNYGKSLVYLDIDMKLTEHNIILTRTHRKTTSTETYLDYRSSHPKHLKHNLPISIFTRSFLLCNTQTTFNLEKERIITRFRNSHYPKKVIQEAIEKTTTKHNIPTKNNQPAYIESRRKALQSIGKKEQQQDNSRIYLPVTYWPYIPIKDNFTKSTWISKLNNCRIKFKQPIVSFKQPPSILRLLSKATN